MPSPDRLDELLEALRQQLLRRKSCEREECDSILARIREAAADLTANRLSPEEACLLAVRRQAAALPVLRELLPALADGSLIPASPAVERRSPLSATLDRRTLAAFALAVGAAAAVKLPALFGVPLDGSDPADQYFYLRNAALLVLPFLAAYFAWDRGLSAGQWAGLSVPFLVGAVVMNLYPFELQGQTQVLAALHLPIVLWLAVGFAHAGGAWRDHDRRMHFIRFTGEWVVNFALIALGGGVLMGLTAAIFQAIGSDPEPLLNRWVLPCGAAGAVLVAAWVAEGRQAIAPGMAPLLGRLFTPLFALMLLGFLGMMAVTGPILETRREVLIAFDLLLVVVLGLLVYGVSARRPDGTAGLFDALQWILVVAALLVDLTALWAILSRTGAYGITPNRAAAVGENVVLLANLAVSALLLGRFLLRRGPFQPLLRWQTAYLPVYGAWAGAVVVLLPWLFGFR
ncbi:MAG: hypothetical protein Kow00109_13070 [Acidobacteriota bacterium]